MKPLNLYPYTALLVLVALLSACSGTGENSATSNTNAPPQGNTNAAPQPQIAQGNVNAAPPPVQLIPPSAEKPSTASTNIAKARDANNARLPKLVVSDKKIDFGKQPQNKTLVRAIVVKNAGRADLKIESVVPS